MARDLGLPTSSSAPLLDAFDPAAPPSALQRAFVLSEGLARRLAAHCALTGDAPRDVVSDAIVLMLDADDLVEEDACALKNL